MPQNTSVENNFVGGLKTEFTGLNFPENACTDVSNCIFSAVGDVTRRRGFEYEANYHVNPIPRAGLAMSYYKWLNVAGDGSTQLFVQQIGHHLYFYLTSAATNAVPLSTKFLVTSVDLTTFVVSGATSPDALECQYASGNGYLFVFHPSCEPFYCEYDSGSQAVTSHVIKVQIRDIPGIDEIGIPDNTRPKTLTDEHLYNLLNQGWTKKSSWTTTSTTFATIGNGSKTFTVDSGLPVIAGDSVFVNDGGSGLFMAGTVTSYSGVSLVVNITSYRSDFGLSSSSSWYITPFSLGYITEWNIDLGDYPSNCDVWWYFKDVNDDFNPAATIDRVSLGSGPAPKGFYILDAFNQQRALISGVDSITDITTTKRPRTGTWFQGRVWYTGVDARQLPTGDQTAYSWSENIYFSQIITGDKQFGMCYQTNDLTSDKLFDLLPTDGGTIKIQGSGPILKLFPLQNGLVVIAANGLWFITGSQGIGFSANDYTIIPLDAIRGLSANSVVNVNGYPIFWNEEGVYTIEQSPQGQQGLSLQTNSLTVSTIATFYDNIPVKSKIYARGDYNPIDYVVQWAYRSTEESSVTDRYEFDSILNFNIHTKAFYTYAISTDTGMPYIHGVTYISEPEGTDAPDSVFKYPTSIAHLDTYNFTFSEERATNYLDWFIADGVGINYESFFETGYKLHGQVVRKFQPTYVYMFLRNDEDTAYKIQGIWDYAFHRDSNRYSTIEVANIDLDYFNKAFKRHRIRGHGNVLQLKIISVDGEPFDIMGWGIWELQNPGV